MAETAFWIFAAAAVASATCCVLSRNPVVSALWLVSTMFSLAGIYVLLQAPFIAAIQVLVYAGAVMVLFLFVIMLLNLQRSDGEFRGPASVGTTVTLVGLLLAELGALWVYSPSRLLAEVTGQPAGTAAAVAFPRALPGGPRANVVADVAAPLFGEFLVPFEVTSVLLLAAIVGAVVLAKRKL
ncbi:MAG: NADH-quinone oxidoreductase subunit J [Gemmatimonadales bacterium]|nr:NADH-quinone oxidoreductase subunit J [Gemmatimonadales bacterium]